MKKQIKTVSLLIVAILLVSVLAGFAGNREKPIKTGIIGAVDMEVDSLKREVRNAKTIRITGMEFCEGLLDGADVVIVKCGMGKVNAGTCAQLLINVFGAKRIINTGVAGSLDASINIGDIAVSKDVVQHDFDLTPFTVFTCGCNYAQKRSEGCQEVCAGSQRFRRPCLYRRSVHLDYRAKECHCCKIWRSLL